MTVVNMLHRGLRFAFRGARRGNAALTGAGAALAAVGFVQRMVRPKRELLWAKTLKPGEAYRIRLLDSGEEIDVAG